MVPIVSGANHGAHAEGEHAVMRDTKTKPQKTEPAKAEPPPLSYLEGESLIPLEAPEGKLSGRSITSLSGDAIRDHYGHLVVQLTTKRQGLKVKHALAIADGTAPQKPATA
jgi:hypothetical protein